MALMSILHLSQDIYSEIWDPCQLSGKILICFLQIARYCAWMSIGFRLFLLYGNPATRGNTDNTYFVGGNAREFLLRRELINENSVAHYNGSPAYVKDVRTSRPWQWRNEKNPIEKWIWGSNLISGYYQVHYYRCE
jgi:hypothetical protein